MKPPEKRWLTPPEYAEARGVKPDKVLGWIRSGSLRAVNFAAKTSGRPRWRISPEAIREFEQVRTNLSRASLPLGRQKRKPVKADVIEFF